VNHAQSVSISNYIYMFSEFVAGIVAGKYT
jgi:hypothetical protein